MHKRHGFTIVEMIVVISVIAILTAIGVIAFTQYQASARDSQRAVRAQIIAESLEKYFEANGEYPPCSAVTAAVSVATGSTGVFKGVSADTLVTPKAPASVTNSIQCGDLTNASGIDFFGYVGDGTSNCTTATTGGACLRFSLRYIEERSSSIKQIDSRHKTDIATSGQIALSTANISFRTLTLNWTPIPNAASYVLQRSTSSTFASQATSTFTGTTASVAGLSPGVRYYFRVAAVNNGNQGDWSNTVSPMMLVLGTPTLTATASGATQINLSWTAASNAATYTIEQATNATFTSATTNSVTGTSRAITGLAPGTTYYFRIRAVNGSEIGSWSNTASATTVVPAPAPYALNERTRTWNTLSGENMAICAYGTLDYTWNRNGVSWLSGSTYKISSVTTITWGQTVTLSTRARCVLNGNYSTYTDASNTLTHSLNEPTIWAGLASYRTAGWSGTCPAYSTNYSYEWWAVGDGGGGWSAGASGTQATSWADLGRVWGDGRVQARITCTGPWGSRSSALGYDRFGPGCFPTGYEKRICYP